MEKFELGSPAWIVALKELLIVYSTEWPRDLELSICEIFTNVPAHLDRNGTGIIAWHFVFKDGVLHFEETAIPEADAHTEVDYQFILPVAQTIFTPEAMPKISSYLAQGRAEGKMKSTDRNRPKVPTSFIRLHNDLTARTL